MLKQGDLPVGMSQSIEPAGLLLFLLFKINMHRFELFFSLFVVIYVSLTHL